MRHLKRTGLGRPRDPSGAPKGAGAAGRRLWKALQDEYEFEEHELVLLREAVRLTDTLSDLQAVIDEQGAVITDTRGERKTHPAVVEARQSRIALARFVAVLRLPSGEDGGDLRRPQRRSGARGTYQLHHYRQRSA